jgi:hypothetical protein
MKYLILFLFPFSLYSQNIDIKPVNGKYTIQLDTNQYFIKRDTSNGVINVSFIPTTSVIKDLESELGKVTSDLEFVQQQIDLFQDNRKRLIRRQKELTLLIGKVRFKIKK